MSNEVAADHRAVDRRGRHAFFIIARVRRALARAQVSAEEIEAFTREPAPQRLRSRAAHVHGVGGCGMNRRRFLGVILAAGVAPAIVRADSLMRIVRETLPRRCEGYTPK